MSNDETIAELKRQIWALDATVHNLRLKNEALQEAIVAKDDLISAQKDVVKELNLQLEAVGAGGVQALANGDKLQIIARQVLRDMQAQDVLHEWHDLLAEALASPQQEVQEHVGYFSFSDECGFDRHDTEEAAKAAAKEMLDAIRQELGGDEWPMDIESVCWGVVVERATEHNQTIDDGGEKYCDYVLKGSAPQPAPSIGAEGGSADALDAARYRWLRNFHAGEDGIRDDLPHIAAGGNYVGAWALHSEEADAAIDAAAIATQKGCA